MVPPPEWVTVKVTVAPATGPTGALERISVVDAFTTSPTSVNAGTASVARVVVALMIAATVTAVVATGGIEPAASVKNPAGSLNVAVTGNAPGKGNCTVMDATPDASVVTLAAGSAPPNEKVTVRPLGVWLPGMNANVA